MGGKVSTAESQPNQQQQPHQNPPQTQKPQQQRPHSNQHHQQPQQNKPAERVIPIHVEGRDEPVIPRHNTTSGSFATGNAPQTERVFGHSPSHFTQYVPTAANDDDFGRPHTQRFQQHPPEHAKTFVPPSASPQPHHQQHTTPTPPPPPQQQQQHSQQEQPSLNQEPNQTAPPTQQQQKPTPLDVIQHIQRDVHELMTRVEHFNGKPKDKDYLYLDEMLTRNLLKLDDIETDGKDNIRQARREAIKCVQGCINILEAKANANCSGNKNVETVMDEGETATAIPEQQQQPASLEVSGEVRTGSVAVGCEKNAEITSMEVTAGGDISEKNVKQQSESTQSGDVEKNQQSDEANSAVKSATDASSQSEPKDIDHDKKPDDDGKKDKKKGKKKQDKSD